MPLIRARDVRFNIKEMGFENGVVVSLERMLDEFAETRQHMRELTELVAQCVDEVEKLIHVGVSLRLKVEQIKRDHEQGNEHGEREG